jgi:peptide/nickel transport system substrate-binding protein
VPAIPPVLDPAGSLEGPLPLIARQVFDTLVQFRDGGSDIEPALATQWAVSPDGLTWTFTLRSGVRFHDGTVLTASTVATNFDRQMFPDHPYHPDQNEGWPRLLRGLPGVVKEVRAAGDRTLRIQLVQPYAPLLTALAHPAFSVVLPVSGEGGATRLLGTGPYRIVDVAPGRIVLEAHPGCWAGPPKTQRIVLLEVDNDDQAEAALDARTLDVWLPAQPPRRKLGATAIPGWRVGLLVMQTEKTPFSRKKVRQAVAAALDPSLLAPALGDLAVPLQSFLPLGVWGHSPGPPLMAANPEAANRLLVESGFAQGITSTLLIGEKSGGIDLGRVAEAVRLALEPARIALAIRIEPADVVRRMTQSGEHEMALADAWVDGGDPHLFLYPLSTSEGAARGGNVLNLSFYRNPKLDDLLIRASQLGFRPERLRLYQRAQRVLADELPWIPLYVRLHWAVARPEVRNLRLHPSGFHRLDRLELGE